MTPALIEYAAALASLVCVWLTVRQNVWCWPIGIVGTVLYTYVFLNAKLYSDTGLQVIFTILQIYGWWLWIRGGKAADGNRPESVVSSSEMSVGSEAEVVGAAVASEIAGCSEEEAKEFSDTTAPLVPSISATATATTGSASSAETPAKPLAVSRLRGPAILRWAAVILVGTILLGRQMSIRTDAALPYVDAFQTVMSLAAQYLMGFKILESWVLWILVDIVSVGMYWSKSLYVTMALYAVFLWLAAMGWHAWYRELKTRENPGNHGPRMDAVPTEGPPPEHAKDGMLGDGGNGRE